MPQFSLLKNGLENERANQVKIARECVTQGKVIAKLRSRIKGSGVEPGTTLMHIALIADENGFDVIAREAWTKLGFSALPQEGTDYELRGEDSRMPRNGRYLEGMGKSHDEAMAEEAAWRASQPVKDTGRKVKPADELDDTPVVLGRRPVEEPTDADLFDGEPSETGGQ
jgi:hypothetical protein